MNKGLFIILSGPSGSGKGTVLNEVFKILPTLGLSVSATTRSARAREVHGVNYYFLSEEEFTQKIANDEFLEHVGKFNNRYGTLKSEIYRNCNEGKDIVLEIEMEGAANIKKNNKEVISIFMMPPSIEALEERLIARGSESVETIKLRMADIDKELACVVDYDYVVVNDTVDNCVDQIVNIIEAERLKL